MKWIRSNRSIALVASVCAAGAVLITALCIANEAESGIILMLLFVWLALSGLIGWICLEAQAARHRKIAVYDREKRRLSLEKRDPLLSDMLCIRPLSGERADKGITLYFLVYTGREVGNLFCPVFHIVLSAELLKEAQGSFIAPFITNGNELEVRPDADRQRCDAVLDWLTCKE